MIPTIMGETMTQVDFRDWFCLKEGRDNYSIVPERDQAFLFGEAEWRDQIEEALRISLVLKEPVRLVWWGQYGIGKTHRMLYMRHVIERDKMSFLPVYVVSRDVVDKSGFERLHYDLVNNLGHQEMRALVASYLKKIELGQSKAELFDRITAVADVANAMRRLGDSEDEISTAAWRFLTGQELAKEQLAFAKVSKSEMDSSVEYAATLKCLATVIQREKGQQLLYLIDQVEALSKITNRNAEAAWIETFRSILDLPNVGIVLCIGAERMEGIPTIVVAPEIVSRFKQNNYLQIPAYEQQVAADFLKGLLAAWTDGAKLDETIKHHELDKLQGFDRRSYPFTGPAFEVFCRYLTVDPRLAKPREIIERLNKATVNAYMRQDRLISPDVLTRQGISA
jgi:hypothetical protein